MKKVKFYTLGCKVNQYETQAIRENFLKAGFKENNASVADVCVINTCSVTARADKESRRLIKKALRFNPESSAIVTGCLAEKDSSQILAISDKIRIVPNRQKHHILVCLTTDKRTNELTNNERFIPLQISDFKDHQRAFLKIQDGCNNFCAYCKVPFLRGSSRSRSFKQVTAELKRLVNRGFKEIVLTGICLGDYRHGDLGLAEALACFQKVKGEFRLRLSSIEPQLINDRLIKLLADSAKICPHLHIPLQSGDKQILKKMNRRYTAAGYLSLIAKVKRTIKNVAITTDILVGFPGESDEQLNHTISCLKEILPLRSHIFPFSPRKGTAAFSLPGRIGPELMKRRLNLVREIARKCSYQFRKPFLNKQVTVLIESRPDKESGLFGGYCENYIRVSVENATKKDVDKLLPVKIKAVDEDCTRGQFKDG